MPSQPYADPVARQTPIGRGADSTLRDCPQGHPNPCGHPYCGECGEQLAGTPPPMWTGPGEAVAVIRHPPHLRRTLLTTVIVGTVLFWLLANSSRASMSCTLPWRSGRLRLVTTQT